jgi:internalin A
MNMKIKKRFISLLVIMAMVLGIVPATFADIDVVSRAFDGFGITDEQLVEMIADGTIPKNITSLALATNYITDVSPLAELTELRWLGLETNAITDISPLSALTELEGLQILGNQIKDISPLAELTNLRSLLIGGNPITDISPIAELKELRFLELVACPVMDFSPLLELPNFEYLEMGNNRILDLSVIVELALKLDWKYLCLYGNLITDISPLARLSDMKCIRLDDNFILDPSPLLEIENLERFCLRGNPMSPEDMVDSLLEALLELFASTPFCEIDDCNECFGTFVVHDGEPPVTTSAATTTEKPIITTEPLVTTTDETSGTTSPATTTSTTTDGMPITSPTVTTPPTTAETPSTATTSSEFLYSVNENAFFGGNGITNEILAQLVNDGIIPLTITYFEARNAPFLTDISPLAKFTNLKTIDLHATRVSDISVLANNKDLWEVLISWNEIRDITPLADLPMLEFVSLGYNYIDLDDEATIAAIEKIRATVYENSGYKYWNCNPQFSDIISVELLEALKTQGRIVNIPLQCGRVIMVDPWRITNLARETDLNVDIEVESDSNQIIIRPADHGEFGFEFGFVITGEELAQAGLSHDNLQLLHVDSSGNTAAGGRITSNPDGSVTVGITHASHYVLTKGLNKPVTTATEPPIIITEPESPTITDALEILKQLAGIANNAPDNSTIHDALEVLKFLAGLPSRFNS